jgi:hypothetical protein
VGDSLGFHDGGNDSGVVGAALSGDDSGGDDGASDAIDSLGLNRRIR